MTNRSLPRRRFIDRFSAVRSTGTRNTSFVQVLLLLLGAVCLSSHAVRRPEVEARESTPESNRSEAVSEYKIKAAFLYNFIRYTNWPKGAFGKDGLPVELVVIGKNPFATTLDATFAGKKVHDRKVHISYVDKLPEKISAHLVFATGLSRADEDLLMKHLRGKHTMLIGDSKGFAERGSCANFYIKSSKVRFQVNPDEVKRSGLEISSQLLKLASIVKTKEQPK